MGKIIAHEEQRIPQLPAQPSPPVSESAAIFSMIERAARDPSVDIDKLKRLMDMQERMQERSAVIEFMAAMQAAQAELPQVVRDADNDQTKSKYARYETISAAIQPIITKHGFSLSFGEGTAEKPNHIRIVCDVFHRAGHTKRYHAEIPIDNVGMKGNPNKTATHAYGSTKSYGKRYLKLDIFDVAVKNEDDDGNAASAPEMIAEAQVTELRGLIDAAGGDVRKLCEYLQIGSLAEIPAEHFDKVKSIVQKKARQS